MQGNQGFFKRCPSCGGKISPSDSHTRCLVCLGEGHRPDLCVHCQSFSRQTCRDRETCLKRALLEASLRPQTMAEVEMSSSAARPLTSQKSRPPSSSEASSASAEVCGPTISEPVSGSLAHARPSVHQTAAKRTTHHTSSALASTPSMPVIKPKDKKKHKAKVLY